MVTMATVSEHRRQQRPPLPDGLTRGVESRRRPNKAEDHRRDDKRNRPRHAGRHFKCQHPGIVHGRYVAADDGARQYGIEFRSGFAQRNGEADVGNHDSDDERQDRQHGVIAGAQTRIERENGDEVRSPNAKAGRSGIQAEPDQTCAPLRDLSAMKEADSGAACQEANSHSEHHQAPVMLGREAVQHPVHAGRIADTPAQ
jgi:hypothetical protein